MDSQKGRYIFALGASVIGAAILTYTIYRRIFISSRRPTRKDSKELSDQDLELDEVDNLEISPPMAFKSQIAPGDRSDLPPETVVDNLNSEATQQDLGNRGDEDCIVMRDIADEQRIADRGRVDGESIPKKDSHPEQRVDKVPREVVEELLVPAVAAGNVYAAPSEYLNDETNVTRNPFGLMSDGGHTAMSAMYAGLSVLPGIEGTLDGAIVEEPCLQAIASGTQSAPTVFEPTIVPASTSTSKCAPEVASLSDTSAAIGDHEKTIATPPPGFNREELEIEQNSASHNNSHVSEDSTNGCASITDSGIGLVNATNSEPLTETQSVASTISSDVELESLKTASANGLKVWFVNYNRA